MKRNLLITLLFFISININAQLVEDFENTTGPDASPSTNWTLASGNWKVFNNDQTAITKWDVTSVFSTPPQVYQGNKAAYCNRSTSFPNGTIENYLVTPIVSVPVNGKLRFHTRTFLAGTQGTIFQIKVAPATANPEDINAYTLLQEWNDGTIMQGTFNIYEEKEVNLSALQGTNVYIAFVMKQEPLTTSLGDRWLIDDVYVTNLASCIGPTNIYGTNVNASGATISWVNTGQSQWEIIIQPATYPTPTLSSTGILTTSNPYIATGLTVNTTYAFYIRTICTDGVSSWSSPITFTPFVSLSPLTTNSTQYTPTQLVTDVLINNPCVQVSNVTSLSGSSFGSLSSSIGYFTNTNPTFPLSSGIVLSTGSVASIPGPNITVLSQGSENWPGDPQLESIILAGTGSTMVSRNATKLEFDFTSLNEFMSFNFLFASEEYGIYQCEYADAFAFLLTDLTTGITTNIAVLPGTTIPISVVTIRDNANNVACASANQNFFDQYFSGSSIYTSATNFNGQTHMMTASSPIVAGNPYHVKLVIADRADTAYDSAVFIQEGSFTTGPPECVDKIRLVSFIDENNNGIKDTGEVEFTYGSFNLDTNNSGTPSSIVSPLGTYTLYYTNPTDVYDFSFTINPEYAPYYTITATSYDDISIAQGSGTSIYYFPIILTQAYNDLSVSITPSIPPRPGMTYINKVIYTNLGATTTSGTLTFTIDPQVTITSISQPGTVATATGFTYDFSNLAPYETRSFYVTMSVPNSPTVNIDDLLTTSASIAAASGSGATNDVNIANNSFTNTEIVVNSYDPNDKMEAHGGKIQHDQFTTNDYLYYTIRFQNNGTANAINIRIEDLLDPRIDEQSLRMVSASHNYVLERIGNQLTWRFDYIQLAPFTLYNEAASKGFVTFKVKLKPGFAVGDIIPNTASIFFDTNPAIVTNTFETEFVQSLGTNTFTDSNLVVYPNPATTSVQIALTNSAEQISAVTLFDMLGKKIIEQNTIVGNQTTINTQALSKGVYLIEIKSTTNQKLVKKLIVQ
jgi:hypothetical protein